MEVNDQLHNSAALS